MGDRTGSAQERAHQQLSKDIGGTQSVLPFTDEPFSLHRFKEGNSLLSVV